ncbi:TPA: site-specific DNA-methyltransferase [Vibrio parahaemolyticus]|nr:site-specific DNA-methyltransferase [Vibrio parahaemolyticus]HCM0851299.1 site-specific DNA-methyltransferase [Vibrio parahaemolyticus]
MKSRELDFRGIGAALKEHLCLKKQSHLVAKGDSLEVIKKIPDNSISLILTDPPYHATKKKNIYGDTLFAKDKEYLDWMAEYAKEWRRILKPNGSLFCYCDSSMSARLEVLFSEEFNILSHVVWTKPNAPGFDGWKGKMKKENLRQWYGHSERIIFAEPAIEGNLHRSPFGQYLREMRKKSGLSGHQLTELTGAYGKVNHGGAVSNWEAGRNTPSREQYDKICSAIIGTGKVDSMLPYEDVIRPFIMDGSKEFTDVWNFESVRPYKGKHPAEKPIDMLKHAIEATSYADDIVLDCFGGSGSTAVAAHALNRKSITIEIEPEWVESIVTRLCALDSAEGTVSSEDSLETIELKQEALF